MINYLKKVLKIIGIIIIFVYGIYPQGVRQKEETKQWSLKVIDPNYKSGEIFPVTNYIQSQETKIYRINEKIQAAVNPNQRVFPTDNSTQTETSIDVNPLNSDILFGSANTSSWPVTKIYGCGEYASINRGINWSGSDNPSFNPVACDPAAVIGANGYFYLGFITTGHGQGIARSFDNGSTWSKFQVADNPSGSGDMLDKNHLMIDKMPGSPYFNRLYDAYTTYVTGSPDNNQITIQYSSDNGETWSIAKNLSLSVNAIHANQGVNIQTGPNGEVYVTWAIYDDFDTGVYGEDAIGFVKSTDGGITWGTAARIFNHPNFGIRNPYLPPKFIRTASFPSMAVDRSGGTNNGNIYITFPAKGVSPAGNDPDILLIKSTDGGLTWSDPVRVNDDPINNGKDQYYSWCCVDQATGALYLAFYDSRNSPGNDSAEVYMAVSFDGAQKFNNIKVSDTKFKPKSISGFALGYQGDYIGISGSNGNAYPFWSEDRTGIYQAWISKVSFQPVISHTAIANTENINGPYKIGIKVSAEVAPDPNKMFLHWTRGDIFTDSVSFVSVTPDSFYALIPGNGLPATYKYYIYVQDKVGNFSVSPAAAPSDYFSFIAAKDTIGPVITHSVLQNQYKETWPALVLANAVDQIGVDSVWVVYKLNYNGILHSFTLHNTENSTYSGLFNIDSSLISIGDTMFYRIVAQDEATAHNLGYNPSALGFNFFRFIGDVTPPEITHTPLKDQLNIRWPALVKADVTDNIGIESVQCEFNINNNNMRIFSLVHQGNAYSGYFNIDTSQLNDNDSIYYRIKAVDISSNHNTSYLPVSGYYGFKIKFTKGLILVVNDDVALSDRKSFAKGVYADFVTPLGASASLFTSALINAGYSTDTVSFANLDSAALSYYDLIILSAGTRKTTMFNNPSKRTALVKYVNNGGRTLVEGGEVGYLYKQTTEIDADFRRTILNDSAWISDAAGAFLDPINPGHNIFNIPNIITGPFAFIGTDYNIKDAVSLAPNKPGVSKLAGWSTSSDSAGIICRYANNNPNDVRNIFFTFAISAMTDQLVAKKLIENTAWLFLHGIFTSVELSSLSVPVGLSLEQNYPNPFNPSTSIKFSIPKEGRVSLGIYNLLGQRIAILLDENRREGFYEIKFEASQYASGIYFYRLEMSNMSITKKMILLK